MNIPKHIIIMKIGYHAGESLNEIINRKKDEKKKSGIIFWGYGGTLLHPTRQVIPFVNESLQHGNIPMLLMCITPSKHQPSKELSKAREFSVDGTSWNPLPEGVVVTGSKYALICDRIIEVNFEIESNEYKVAVGRRKGQSLGEYLKFRIDKACASLNKDSAKGSVKIHVSLIGELTEPYATFLR